MATMIFFVTGFLLTANSDVKTYRVEGRVTFDDRIPKLRPLDMNADPACSQKNPESVPNPMLEIGADKGLANILITIQNPPQGSYAPLSTPAVVTFDKCMYVPRVIAVGKGQQVKFVNSDGILHNVHGLPKVNREFNIGMPPTYKEATLVFNETEDVFAIKDDVHPWERVFMTVLDHPFYAVTGKDGKFRLDNLPDGTFQVRAWHERLPAMTGTVTIAGGNATLDFSFKAPKRK